MALGRQLPVQGPWNSCCARPSTTSCFPEAMCSSPEAASAQRWGTTWRRRECAIPTWAPSALSRTCGPMLAGRQASWRGWSPDVGAESEAAQRGRDGRFGCCAAAPPTLAASRSRTPSSNGCCGCTRQPWRARVSRRPTASEPRRSMARSMRRLPQARCQLSWLPSASKRQLCWLVEPTPSQRLPSASGGWRMCTPSSTVTAGLHVASASRCCLRQS
mmetsp:Transcript_65380/g.151678  ORF Transcript_65380/g.151678 Transcript_65380/m.151678 type:complete len:217 (-) Transcript_65380:266-916(-)